MDTTQPPDHGSEDSVEELLASLETIDPAQAPPVAESLATLLSDQLDTPSPVEDAAAPEPE